MKKLFLVLLLAVLTSFVFCFQGYSDSLLEGPYAPVFIIPEGLESADRYLSQQERVKSLIPKKEEVNVSPYPGAVVFLVHTTDELKQVTGKAGLAEIKIIVTDPLEDVVEFYNEQLPDWSYNETFSIFWEGKGDFSISKLMEGMPHISIVEASPVVTDLVPEATFLIGIVYEVR